MIDNEVQGELGEHIDEAITRVLELAIQHDETFVLVFNGTKLTINPNSSFDVVRAAWDAFNKRTAPEPETQKPIPVLPEGGP